MKNKTKLITIIATMVIILCGSNYLLGALTKSQKEKSESAHASESVEQPATPTSKRVESDPEDDKIEYLDAELTDMDGNKVMLSDFVGSHYVVLNFWATWCGPCKNEMPHFYEAESEYKDKNVVFLMINQTDGNRETKETVEEYLNENEFEFEHILLDLDGKASGMYGLVSLPSTLFIDLDGNVVSGKVGAMEAETLQEYLDDLVK